MGDARKIGRNKKSPTMVAYKAQDRCARNKKGNIAREARRQAENDLLRPERKHRRRLGAERRISGRIRQYSERIDKCTDESACKILKAERARLERSRCKIVDSIIAG